MSARIGDRKWRSKAQIHVMEKQVKTCRDLIDTAKKVPCLGQECKTLCRTTEDLFLTVEKIKQLRWITDLSQFKDECGIFVPRDFIDLPDGRCTSCHGRTGNLLVEGWSKLQLMHNFEGSPCMLCSGPLCGGSDCKIPECAHVIRVHLSMFTNPNTWRKHGCGFICGLHSADQSRVCWFTFVFRITKLSCW